MCEYSLSPELARARTGFAPDPGAGSVKPIAASPDDLELRGHPLAPPCEIGARFRSPQPTSHDNRLATPFAEPSQETPHRQLTASAKSDSHARGRWFDPSRAHLPTGRPRPALYPHRIGALTPCDIPSYARC